jgi:hypothetical protein
VQKPAVVDDVYVTVTTPDEFVAPAAAGVNVPQDPAGDGDVVKETTSPLTGEPVELVTVAVIVDVDVPLSTTELGLAVTATALLAVWVITCGVAAAMLLCDSTAWIVHVPAVAPAV